MAISGINQTEYTSNATATSQSSGVGNQSANSIYDEANKANASVEEKKNTSKLDELLEKLCAEFSKFGLKPEEVKNSGVLYRISGMNQKQIESANDEKIIQIIDCLKAAIKDSIVDGKIDLEKVGKLGNTYFIAVNTGWTIEGFKKYDNGVKKSSLLERLKETGFLKSDATLENIKPDELEKALFDFFNKTLLSPLKNAKSIKEKATIYKGQLQTFGRLLINTPDKEKAIFKQAIATLAADSRLKGLNAVLASFETPQAKEAWADSWTKDELVKVMITKDVEGNVPSNINQTSIVAAVFTEKSEESIRETYSQMSEPAKLFFKENAEKLEAIKEKETKGIELTNEEKELVAQRDLYKNLYSGAMSGTAVNTKVAQETKKEILSTMNKDAYKLPIYREVIEQIYEYFEEHPETLTMSNEELTKLLDEVTNGNYSIVASNTDAELNAPYEEKQGTVGLENNQSLEEHKQNLAQQQTTFNNIITNYMNSQSNEKFVVDKKEEHETGIEVSNVMQINIQRNKAFQSVAAIPEYLKASGETTLGFVIDIYKNYGMAGQSIRQWASNKLEEASAAMQKLFLNNEGVKNSYYGMMAIASNFDLSRYNLNLSAPIKKMVDNKQEQNGFETSIA